MRWIVGIVRSVEDLSSYHELGVHSDQGQAEGVKEMDPLLAQGFTLALYGMGTVFFFLTLLVLVTSAMSSIVQRFEPVVTIPAAESTSDTRKMAAIATAIHQYRTDHES